MASSSRCYGASFRLSKPLSSQTSESRLKRRSSTNPAYRPIKRRLRSTSPSTVRSATISPLTVPYLARQFEDRDDEDESLDHIIMAIDRTNIGTIGCAYYVAHEELLRCVEPVANGGMEAIETLKTDIQPTVLLISPRVDHTDLGYEYTHTQRQNSLVTDDHDQRPLPYELVLRPGSDFKYETGVNKLSTLQLSGSEFQTLRYLVPGADTDYDEAYGIDETGLTDQTGRILHVSGQFDLDNKLSVGCMGAVIAYLQRRRASEYLQDDPDARLAYRISRVETTSLKDCMLVNADTLASLQIVQPEFHPNAAKQGPGTQGSKESLSVYGLFCHFARTPQGKTRLKQLFLRPSLNRNEIDARLKFIAVCSSASNQPICEKVSKSLSRIKNMRSTIVNLRKGIEGGNRPIGRIKTGVWTALLEFCYHTIDITTTLEELEGGENLALWIRVQESLDKNQLRRVGKMVHDIVDLDQSAEQRRTVIKRDIDQDLDKVKDAYDEMSAILTKIAKKISDSMPPEINISPDVTFLPQLGFHIVMPLSHTSGQPVYNGAELQWERVFTTEDYAYFKDTKMQQMDTQFGDLYAVICEAEIEISHNLAQRVLQEENLLLAVSDLCGELDALLALVHGAIQYKLRRPAIVETNIIKITGGRHILQEMTVPSFVPNDTVVAGGQNESPNMILLTGPNFSGKSVYMKQVALINYMAQVGSFVPATSATIGITDKILTRITTRETVTKIQSAFMIDLQQITRALKSCTPRSLVIIDELGKGTDTCDGAGLAAAVFEHLLSLQDQCPKILASTHFHEILDDGRFDQYQNLNLAHMEVHVNRKGKKTSKHCGEVAYLYNIQVGLSVLSYGSQCAAMNGVPAAVVERATNLSELAFQGADLVGACSILPAEELAELEDAEILARKFLTSNFEQTAITYTRGILNDMFMEDAISDRDFNTLH